MIDADTRRAMQWVQNELRGQLDVASAVYRHGTEVLTRQRGSGHQTIGITEEVALVGLGACVKVLRQLHAIIALNERGLGEEAEVNVRVGFESLLALRWVLARRVVLRQDGKAIIRPRMTSPKARFRAMMYLVHEELELQHLLTVGRRRPFGKGVTTANQRRSVDTAVRNAERQIGSDWLTLLRKTKSYSTLNQKDLADSVGLIKLYDLSYKVTSWAVHAADLTRYARISEDGDLVFRTHSMAVPKDRSLAAGAILALDAVKIVTDRFGLENGAKLAALEERVQHAFSPDWVADTPPSLGLHAGHD